jgi:hypothetical protein
VADHLRHGFDQFRLPGAGDADDLREVGGAVGQEAAAAFVVDQRGDAQPRLFDKETLDGIGQLAVSTGPRLLPPARRVT